MEPPAVDWLSAGGAYFVIGGTWIVIAIFYYIIGDRIGRAARQENDGCLLGIMNILLTIFGGGTGLLLFRDHYPLFVPASMVGALVFPTVGTLFIIRLMRHRS
jgi:hypothetical protein